MTGKSPGNTGIKPKPLDKKNLRNSFYRGLWIALVLTGCATPPVTRPHKPPLKDFQFIVDRIHSRERKIRDLSGFSKFRIRSQTKNLSGTAVVNIKKRAYLRLEFLNLFSQPIQYFLANERHLILYTPREKTAVSGRPDAKSVNRLIGVRMGIEELISFFLGVPPDLNRFSQESAVYNAETSRYHLKAGKEDGGGLAELWIDSDTFCPVQYHSYDKEGNVRLRVSWDNFRSLNNISVATEIFIELPGEKTTLEVRFTDFDINKGIASDIFSFEIPPDTRLLSLGL